MQKQTNQSQRLAIAKKNIDLLAAPFKHLYLGIVTNTIPWPACAGWTAISTACLFFKIDQILLLKTPFKDLYPSYSILYKLYAFAVATSAFWIWAWIQVKKEKDKLRALTHAFKNAGLESRIGRLPNLISDFAIDPLIRKMRMTNAGFPLAKFQEQAKYLESELGIFIDEIKESREYRSVDIIYSHYPMATEVKYEQGLAEKSYEFFVGKTRSQDITASLKDIPHLLVAGQTGGGKSTFLRQLIVHLYLNQEKCRFLLIDLKGGLEFSLFENRKRFSVMPDVNTAIRELKQIDKLLTERMRILKENHCKDVESYYKKLTNEKKKRNLERQIIVVDEAAEMFLAGYHGKANEIQVARGILSRIARQGRAVGIHLIIATQRPDARSLDPQVKANLIGVICFQMMNDSSSIAVLGNGRATDLPKIPGRAIWKNGIEMLEVQTPLLTVEAAEAVLGEPDDKDKENAPAEITSNSNISNKLNLSKDHFEQQHSAFT